VTPGTLLPLKFEERVKRVVKAKDKGLDYPGNRKSLAEELLREIEGPRA